MLPTHLRSGDPYNASRNRMFLANLDLADKQKADALDRLVERQKEEAMRNLPNDLEVLPSPLLLEQMEREAAQRQRVRFAAAPPMPSSLAPAHSTESSPDELEERLRFYARQIKSFRTTSIMYSSPVLMDRISQMERDYETADSRELLLLPSSPRQDSRELLQLQSSPRHDSRELLLLLSSPRQDSRTLLLSSPRQPDSRPDTPQPDSRLDPKSASTSSTHRRGRRKRDASAQVIRGPGDASASAHATEGLGDASAPAHATEGLGNVSATAYVTEGPADASAPAPSLQAFQGFSEKLVLVLASEPIDEGFEEEALPDSVSGEFKVQLFLVPVTEGPPDSVPVSGGPAGSASASEGSPGSASASEGSPDIANSKPDSKSADSKPPGFLPGSKPDARLKSPSRIRKRLASWVPLASLPAS
ncbi:hypothetical protein CRENBAI_004010 [Crenichthys baileyi]|uniref:Uncharacterized protein n=1 Tax=Crenichthys baileyi TaxID=28760 RepID=A0AAV9R7V2_9TELE